MRRIATANTTLAAVSVAGVVGLTAMLAQQGTHHAAAKTATVTTMTVTTPTTTAPQATVQQAPQVTVQQAPPASTHHVVTSGS